ncbi:MAG: hypothetical protein ACH349_04275 [Candidatus Rhabdochlamydia sp.]|jgi:hypothetical protein|nr:hypothetical protein [Chlamydiota bacterium]
MLPLIHAVISHDNKNLSDLEKVPLLNLPKLTRPQKAFEIWNQFLIKLNATHHKTEHSKNKELIVKILGGNTYHAVKIHSFIKNKNNFSGSEFARLKNRCDKIHSNQVLLEVFIEIMHIQKYRAFLTQEQLKILLSSFPEEMTQLIDKGLKTYKSTNNLNKNATEEMLFVLETLCNYNFTGIDFKKVKQETKCTILNSSINSCLERAKKIEEKLFSNNEDKKPCQEAILRAVEKNLSCLSIKADRL